MTVKLVKIRVDSEKEGTREGIFNLRTINERYLEKQKDVYICIIDYEKAFDRVNHEKRTEKLKLDGMDGKDVQILARLYWEQAAVVRADQILMTIMTNNDKS